MKRQQLPVLVNLIIFTIVTIKIDGYIIFDEAGQIFDHIEDDRSRILRFVKRTDWQALPTTEVKLTLDTPVPYIMIYHTGTESCFHRKSCDQIVRSIQAKFMKTYPWDRDIGYNFLISGDGNVYFGRGWNFEGAHTIGINRKSIGIGMIGTFYDKNPSVDQLDALVNFIKFGICFNYIQQEFKYYSEPDMKLPFNPKNNISNILQIIESEI